MKTYVEIPLEQGSPEWLDFRRRHRMASETPAILGVSPYATIAQVRDSKRGVVGVQTEAMRFGVIHEPKARELYSTIFNEPMRPVVIKSGDYGASLDGISIDEETILEIKCPFRSPQDSARWIEAKNNSTIPHDYAQIQHQLMVSEALKAHLFIFDAFKLEHIHVEVLPDPAFWEKIHSAWEEFWPQITQRDDEAWALASSVYLKAKQKADLAAKELETAKKDLLRLTTQDYTCGAGVEVRRTTRRGLVDWPKVQAIYLEQVDLELYRKPDSVFFEVKQLKKGK